MGKRALITGMHIADDVISYQNIKQAAKRRAMMRKMLSTSGVRPGQRKWQRINRATATRQVNRVKRRRAGQTGDAFDDGFHT